MRIKITPTKKSLRPIGKLANAVIKEGFVDVVAAEEKATKTSLVREVRREECLIDATCHVQRRRARSVQRNVEKT
jgi:hypothetical protein